MAFVEMMTSQAGDVSNKLNTTAAIQLAKNRAALKRIIQAIEYHGRLGLPLRGHRDYGKLVTQTHCAGGSVNGID